MDKKPAIGILNPAFKYTPARSTNIRETFARIRQQQQAVKPVVVQIKRRGSSS